MERNLYEIIFTVGLRQLRWTRFAPSVDLARSEALPALAVEHDGKAKIVSVTLTSIQAEEAR